MKQNIYLDYNATAPLLDEARDAMHEAMQLVGNPSSIHGFGREVRKHIEIAREQVAVLVSGEAKDVTFTSGATEANNAVMFGAPVERTLISAIEHPSILDAAHGRNVTVIPVTSSGIIDLSALEEELKKVQRMTLVSIMWVNNETGVIQPIEEIAALVKKYNALFHTDAVQAAGRLPLHMNGIDYLTLSAHKIGGPAGVGALIYDHDTPLEKFIRGGGQEKRRRAGTENMMGIIGFGAAAAAAQKSIGVYKNLGKMRDDLEKKMQSAVPDAIFVGQDAPRVGNTIQVILPAASAEKQLMALDLAGIAVSSGSACSSGSVKPSHVLLAMGFSPALAGCALRLSMGPETSDSDLETFFRGWVANSQRLRAA